MRWCRYCGNEITEWMGFVSAGDYVRFLHGEIPAEQVREMCGVCDLRYSPDLIAFRLEEAEKFVRRALSHLGQEADDKTVSEAAAKVVKSIPPFSGSRPRQRDRRR